MYLNYFGLAERPFSIAPDPQYLYMSARHREAMAHLSYGLSQGGCFIVLTGEVGTGKTTLCRNLLADLPDNVDVALILNPNINRRELLETVCDELKIKYPELQSKKKLLDSINDYLLKTYAENRHTVLIIDEAQLLSRTVLEQVRLLTNLETTKSKLLQIILIGQPELNDLLGRNDLRQLAQRVTARYHLPAISKNEIQEYVNFRLSVAGGKKPLFSSQALKLLHHSSGGIPRKINVLADHALLSAYSKSQAIVDSKIIKQSAKEVLVKKAGSGGGFLKRGKFAWALIAAGIVALNIGLWWWFSGSDESAERATQTSSAQPQPAMVPNNSSAANNGEPTQPATQPIAQPASSSPRQPSDQSETIDLSQLGSQNGAQNRATGPVAPGSVVIADEYLDDSVETDSALSLGSVPGINDNAVPRLVEPEPNLRTATTTTTPSQPPAYLQVSAFGRVLEVSPDRTGRIAAFKNLAAAWDADLPDTLLRPVCDEVQAQGVLCLSAVSWAAVRRFNRPTILVLDHKGQQHRVILYRVVDDIASVLVGEQNYDVPVSELRDRWASRATVFWRPTVLGSKLLQSGDRSENVPLIRRSLNRIFADIGIGLFADVESTEFDAEMVAKTKLLQQRFGLQADGRIGRETYLLINEKLNKRGVPTLAERS